LQEGIQEKLLVVRGPNDRRDRLETGLTAGPPATLTHDELVAVGAQLPDDDRLEETDLLDGGDQFLQRVLVEDLTPVAGCWRGRVEGELRKVGAHGRRGHLRVAVDRRLLGFM